MLDELKPKDVGAKKRTANEWLDYMIGVRPGFFHGGNVCGCAEGLQCDRCFLLKFIEAILKTTE